MRNMIRNADDIRDIPVGTELLILEYPVDERIGKTVRVEPRKGDVDLVMQTIAPESVCLVLKLGVLSRVQPTSVGFRVDGPDWSFRARFVDTLPKPKPTPEVAENEVLIHVNGDPDKEDNRSFTIFWRVDYNPELSSGVRGQCFHASLQYHVDHAISSGKRVRVVNKTRSGLGLHPNEALLIEGVDRA